MNYGIYFGDASDLNVHFTSEIHYDKIQFEDLNLLVLRYKRRGEMTWTIMPVAKIAYITEG
jgi:hypothetical protein